MVVAMLPVAALAAEKTVSTLDELLIAINEANGTVEEPTEITVSGTIEVTKTIKIPSDKHVKLVGSSLSDGFVRGEDFNSAQGPITNYSHLLSVQGSLVLENLTIDGNNGAGGSLVFIYGDNAAVVMNGETTLKNNRTGAVKLYSQNSTEGNPCSFTMM